MSRKTIVLAEKLGVPVKSTSQDVLAIRCKASAPNWVTCPWPSDYEDVLDWQWNEVVAPYWIEGTSLPSTA